MAKDNQPDNKTMDPLMEPVRQYLEKRAAEDPQFAEKFRNPKKSLKECCSYIYGEARKRAAGSECVYIAPDEVFGMAVHYYDEDNIKVSGSGYTGRASAAATTAPKPVELTKKQKEEVEKRALEKYEAEQREKARRKAEAEKKKAAREEAERRRREDGDLFNLFAGL